MILADLRGIQKIAVLENCSIAVVQYCNIEDMVTEHQSRSSIEFHSAAHHQIVRDALVRAGLCSSNPNRSLTHTR
jgi:hypothetical protein